LNWPQLLSSLAFHSFISSKFPILNLSYMNYLDFCPPKHILHNTYWSLFKNSCCLTQQYSRLCGHVLTAYGLHLSKPSISVSELDFVTHSKSYFSLHKEQQL
jgi:hypothetical protein